MKTQTENPLHEVGKANEEFYFRNRDLELQSQMKMNGELSRFGIADEALILNLYRAGFNPDSLRAVFIVPLIEVAWADGKLEPEENDEILKMVQSSGIRPESEAYRLIFKWLTAKPNDDLFHKAQTLIAPLLDEIRKQNPDKVKWILDAAQQVAQATGGLLYRIGIGGPISTEEEEVIARVGRRILKKDKSLTIKTGGEK